MEEKKWSKEKEELFNRWTKYHTKENRGIVGFQQSMEDVLDFILEELDRAREETRQEERDMFIVRYATVSFNEVIKTIKTLSIIEFLSIKWGLKGKKKSKLTTK